ncbi:MAG: hypothetical protein U0487_01645 [Patescibacteria group bacterium]
MQVTKKILRSEDFLWWAKRDLMDGTRFLRSPRSSFHRKGEEDGKEERPAVGISQEGIVEFASELISLGWRIISSSGTAKVLQAAGPARHRCRRNIDAGHPRSPCRCTLACWSARRRGLGISARTSRVSLGSVWAASICIAQAKSRRWRRPVRRRRRYRRSDHVALGAKAGASSSLIRQIVEVIAGQRLTGPTKLSSGTRLPPRRSDHRRLLSRIRALS